MFYVDTDRIMIDRRIPVDPHGGRDSAGTDRTRVQSTAPVTRRVAPVPRRDSIVARATETRIERAQLRFPVPRLTGGEPAVRQNAVSGEWAPGPSWPDSRTSQDEWGTTQAT